MKIFVLFLVIPSVFSTLREYWITPCGHVYKKADHPFRVVRTAETLLRLKNRFEEAQKYVSKNEHLGVLEGFTHDPQEETQVVLQSTFNLYTNIDSITKMMKILPITYRTLQDLAFSLRVVHDELAVQEDEDLRKKHSAVAGVMERNAQLLCELDFAMNRNNIEFSRIDQLTLTQEMITNLKDRTFSHVKHSHILWEYRSFIKHVSSQLQKFV